MHAVHLVTELAASRVSWNWIHWRRVGRSRWVTGIRRRMAGWLFIREARILSAPGTEHLLSC